MNELKRKILELIPIRRGELFERIRLHVDDEMLRRIAAADHGWLEQEHLAFFKAIIECGGYGWETGDSHIAEEPRSEVLDTQAKRSIATSHLARSSFRIQEVLELSCYGPHLNIVSRRISWTQLFACWLQLQMQFSGSDCFRVNQLAPCVFVSASLELGEEVAASSIGFLVQMFQSLPDTDADSVIEAESLGCAIVLLAMHVWGRRTDGSRIDNLVDWAESLNEKATEMLRFWDQQKSRGISSYAADVWLEMTRATLRKVENLFPLSTIESLTKLNTIFESRFAREPELGPFGAKNANLRRLGSSEELARNRFINAMNRFHGDLF